MSLSLKEADALETETKLFEDLEFQQLERESRVEEERELAGQGLLRSKAELLRSVSKRKVRQARSLVQSRGAGWRLVTWARVTACDHTKDTFFVSLLLSNYQ